MIALHLGADCTDGGALIRSMLRSRSVLATQAIVVPPPRHYRTLIRAALAVLNGDTSAADRVGAILDDLVADQSAERTVLFAEGLICEPGQALDGQMLYPLAPLRLAAFRALVPGRTIEFQMALCNPAILVPTLAGRPGGNPMTGQEARALSWLSTLTQIIRTNPGIRLTLWCNEDTPLIWPEVLRAVSGYQGPALLDGDNDLLSALLTDEGYTSLARSLIARPPASAADRRDRISAALEANARAGILDMDVALPGWNSEDIDAITESYVADCAEIARLPGVRFIAP